MGSNKYCAKCGFELPSYRIKKCPECGADFGKKERTSNIQKHEPHKSSEKKGITVARFQLTCALLGALISSLFFIMTSEMNAVGFLISLSIGLILGWIVALIVILILVSIKSVKGSLKDVFDSFKTLFNEIGIKAAIIVIVCSLILAIIAFFHLMSGGSIVVPIYLYY